jgi:lysozyme
MLDNATKLRAELVRDEGKRLVAYKDSVGLWTIGIGHLLGVKARMTEITNDEAMALLDADIQTAEKVVWFLVPESKAWSGVDGPGYEEVRYRALVNMAFNLGPNRLAGFKKFIVSVNTRKWEQAAVEMMQSKWATQVGARATRLRDMMLTGKEPV